MDVPGGPGIKTSSSNAAGTGSIPGWGIKIPHAVQYGQKKKKECHYHLMWCPNTIFKRRS